MSNARGTKRDTAFQLDVHGAFLRRTDLSRANLEGANLSGADFSNAVLRGANFKDANLDGTILNGADLRDAQNLTQSQLSRAIFDEATQLPEELSKASIRLDREQVGSRV